MKHFISVHSTSPHKLVELARTISLNPLQDATLGRHKTLGLIFLNPSLRTRLSTQKAAQNIGMNTMILNLNQDGWKVEFNDNVIMNGEASEHIREAAQVIGQYCDIIGIRCFPGLQDRCKDYSEDVLKKFIEFSGRPIVSLESCTLHPLQSLADMLTIEEYKKTKRPKVVMTWAPHIRPLPQSVPNSFAEWALKFDYEFVITHPKGYELDLQFTSSATIIHDQDEALQGADFVYAKSWSSFSQYGELDASSHSDWQITAAKMNLTNRGIFLHCLPIRRNLVASDEVLDSPYSKVIQQAKNREYAAQAVLSSILKGSL